jgi:hypothetical protein
MEQVADIEWKGATWKAAHDELTVPELLTVLKGYGPMEVLVFEKPGCCRGEISLCLTEDGAKEVTLYLLDAMGEPGRGRGKAALQWLKKIFRGPIYVEFPEAAAPNTPLYRTLLFWIRMFRKGLIDSLDCEYFSLDPKMNLSELDKIEETIRPAPAKKTAAAARRN